MLGTYLSTIDWLIDQQTTFQNKGKGLAERVNGQTQVYVTFFDIYHARTPTSIPYR